MRKFSYLLGVGLLSVGLVSFVTGCESGGDSDSGSSTPISVLGKWEAEAPDGFNFMLEFTQQDGAQTSGRGATHGTGGDLSGTVDGNVVDFVVVWPAGSNQANATGGSTEGTATVNGSDMVIDSPDYSETFTIHLL